MAHYRSVGDVPAKRHTLFPRPGGGYHAEELMGAEGFSQESALLYHRHSPSAVSAIEPINGPAEAVHPNQPLQPHHLRTGGLTPGTDPVLDRRLLLANDDIGISWVSATESSGLYRNGVGDEVVFVHQGRGTMESTFGSLAYGPGDYVVVPTSTTHRWVVDVGPFEALVAASSGHLGPPARYMSDRGQFLEGTPYCERDLRAPTDLLAEDDTSVDVVVRTRAGLTRHTHAHHPLDVVGWDGCLYPYALAISDFEPLVGSLHQPPPVHQTFAGPGVVICSFVPRPFDFHPDAVKIPYHHSNVDSDEVLFYVDGDFMSRAGSGIDVGSISLHPAGFVHGPHPGSVEASLDATSTEETAVMIDTFRPLGLSDAAAAVSDPEYPRSWLG